MTDIPIAATGRRPSTPPAWNALALLVRRAAIFVLLASTLLGFTLAEPAFFAFANQMSVL